MGNCCFHCGKEIPLLQGGHVGRLESCPHCKADMHCCRNCSFYDEKAYNQCRESQAERVLDKDRSNYCDYFRFRDGAAASKATDAKTKALHDLDALFKK